MQTDEQREQDHRNWLNELELSTRERRPFTLATDPHKCKFGQWYENYRAEHSLVAALLKKFDAPHQQIHKLAAAVETLKASGQQDQSLRLIDEARQGVLANLIKLFAELKDLIRDVEREPPVILVSDHRQFAISMDRVLSIEKFPPENIEEVPALVSLSQNSIVRRLARPAKSKDVVLLIETVSLMAGLDLARFSGAAGTADR